MRKHMLNKILFVFLPALAALLVSCSSNSAVKAGNYLQIRMHDFPIQNQDVEKVIVEIRKIEVNNSVSGWMTVSDTERKYDLLELINGKTVIILDSPLPIGTYTEIRLELNPDNEIVANSVSSPLKVPSGTETGIKLITPFDIREGKMVEVTLDFDAQKSVNYTKGDGFHLKPVIKVEKIAEYDAAGLVTTEGGNVTTVDGVLNIQVPAGAVSESIIVTAEKVDVTAFPAPDETQSVGIAYDLGPDGQTFNSAVLLSFHYNEAALADKGSEEDLGVYRYDESTAAWIEVPSTVLGSADTVQAWVNHFSVYALFILSKTPGVIELPFGVIGRGLLSIPSMPVFQDDSWSCGVHSANRLMRAYNQVEDYNSMRNVIGSYEIKLSYDYMLGQYIPSPLPPYPCPTWSNPFKICYPPNLLVKLTGSKDITIDTGVGKPDKILVADLQKYYRPTFRTADRQGLAALLQKIDSGKPVMTILQVETKTVDLNIELAMLLTGWFILGPTEIRYPQLHWVVVNGYDDKNIYWHDTYDNLQHATGLTDFYHQWNWQKESFDYVIRRLLEDQMNLHPRTMMWIDETLSSWTATSYGPWQSAVCDSQQDPSSCWNSGTETCDGNAGSAYVCPTTTYQICTAYDGTRYLCPVPPKTCNDVRNYQRQVDQSNHAWDTWDYRIVICGY